MGRRYGTVSPPRVRNLITVPADAVLVHVPNDMFWGKGCPYSPNLREGSFSETRRRDCPTQSLCPEPELQKGSYCNKRRKSRTSTIMIRATITLLPSWNALRRSYLKLLLFLLRPIVLLSLLPGGRHDL